MSPHLDALLCRRYPALFARRYDSTTVTAMGRGIACDDGWFDLIDELCAKLQAVADSGRIEQPVAEQVKEKFGELRFYLAEMTPEARALIEEACERSAVTCEICGAPGVLRRQCGVQTLCDLHTLPGSAVVEAVSRRETPHAILPFFVFLGFDGVLHARNAPPDTMFVNADRLARLLDRYSEALIVVSSSWGKTHDLAALKGVCGPLLGPRLHDVTPIVKRVADGPIHFARFKEIAYWLGSKEGGHPPSDALTRQDWIAVDAAASGFPPECEQLIEVSGSDGLNERNFVEIERWLMRHRDRHSQFGAW